MSQRKLDHKDYTVGWICCLDCEANAARALLDEEDEPLDPALNDDNLYLLGRIGSHNVVIAFPDVYGTISIARAVTNLVRTFPNIRFGLMVGVGGGAPSAPHPNKATQDIRLGDVVVSEPKGNHGGVLNYDMGKWKNDNEMSIESHLNSPPAVLLQGIRRLRLDQRFGKGKMVQYIQEAVNFLRALPDANDPSFPGRHQDQLFRSDYDHVGGADCIDCDHSQTLSRLPRALNTPAIHYGLIASGNAVIRSAKFRDRLRDTWNVSCFEMEAAGLMNHFPCIVIRGICDYSDGHKSKIWQPYAAITAAAYTKDLLRVIGPETVTRTEVATNILQDVFNTLDHVDENVREITKTVRAAYNTQVLDWLSPLDYQNQQSDIFSHRQEETGQWLLETLQFQHWQETPKASLLCQGIPGAGKTIMASIVIDHLYRQLRESSVVGLAYLYCNYRRQDEETFTNLLASLLKQLCLGKDLLPECVNKVYETHKAKNTRPSTGELLALLHTVIETHQKVYIVVDAVDEINTSNGTCRMFLSALFGLQQSTGIQIFATSRFNADISKIFEDKKSVFLEIRALDDDIRSYVEGQFTQMQPFIMENATLRSQIKDGIVKAVDGMFLLAKLHLDSLRDKITRSEVRQALLTLPKRSNSYDTMYEDVMARIQAQGEGHKALAARALGWITCTQRPLTTLELQHALAMGTDIGTFEKDDIPDLDIIIAVCCGIVTVDEKSHIVRLVHFTAQEYFDRNWKRWFPQAHSEIAIVCLANISLGKEYSTKTGPEDRTPNVLFEYSSRYCGYHGKDQSEQILPLLEILKDETRVSTIGNHHSIRCLCGGPCYDQQASNATGLHLAAYFGFHKLIKPLVQGGINCNAKDSFGRTPLVWAAACNNYEAADVLLEHGASPNSRDVDQRTPISWAAGLGNAPMVKLLHSKGAAIWTADSNGKTPWGYAIYNGHDYVANVLKRLMILDGTWSHFDDMNTDEQNSIIYEAMENGYIDVIDGIIGSGMKYTQPLLLSRAREGDIEMVRNLLQQGISPDYWDLDWGRSPISQAAEYDRPDIVRLLLDEHVDPNMRDRNGTNPTQDNEGETALMWAGRCGRVECGRILLEYGADPNLQAKYGQTALIWASRNGTEELSRSLIERGADINLRDQGGRHALSWAAECGHERIVRLLLEQTSVDLDAPENCQRTALMWSAINGHVKIVEMLIHKGADPDLRDECGRHVLSWAADRGHESVVRLLLEQTAVDIDAQENCERTALMWAAVNGHLTIAELLIRKGANPNIRDDWGRHALSYTAEWGHEAIVRLLVEETPVNINNQGTRGRTALMWAAMKGRRRIVELLLRHDADAQIRCFDDKRALEWALEEGHDDVAQILEQHHQRGNSKGLEWIEISKIEN